MSGHPTDLIEILLSIRFLAPSQHACFFSASGNVSLVRFCLLFVWGFGWLIGPMISNQPLLFYVKGTRAWGQLEATVRRSQCGGHSAAHCWLAHICQLADAYSQSTVFSLASPAGLRTETKEVSMGRPSVCEFFHHMHPGSR